MERKNNSGRTVYFKTSLDLFLVADRVAKLEGLTMNSFASQALENEVRLLLRNKPHILDFLKAEGVDTSPLEKFAA